MKEKTRYEFEFIDPEVEDLFLRYVGYERSTVERVVNTAILMYLSMNTSLTKAERAVIKQAVNYYKQHL